MQGQWRVECLGALRGLLGDTVVSRFRTRRAAVLFAYLALNKGRSHPREELIAMLWTEADEVAGRARLRLALASLRRQFEPPSLPKGCVIQAVGDSLQMNSGMVSTDVDEFEALIAAAARADDDTGRRDRLERAAALYQGELLPGYSEEWITAERSRLSEVYETALNRLVSLCRGLGEPEKALAYGRKLLAIDPWNEEIHCEVMRISLEAGNPRAVTRQYEALTEALKELGEEPGPEATQLAAAARDLPLAGARSALQNIHPAPLPAAKLEEDPRAQLPVRLTRFFGRTEEMRQIVQRLTEGPGMLVTLTGPGGAGKTRLSIEAGYVLAEAGWHVSFVPLADVGSPARIFDAILTSLRIGKGQDAVADIARFIGRYEKPLLILDNLEHLLDDAAKYVQRLLAEVPGLHLMVTSRQILALEGEREIAVSPLPTPSAGDLTPERAVRLPSVQLYVDRCQAIRPDFQLSTANVAQIAELCSRLEGIPLAIEIAASLSRTLSPRQLSERLDHRLDVLVSPRRDISDRQRTLRNTIAYSYDLLSQPLARLFLELSVFRGGWTIESAAVVCGSNASLTTLGQLRERSLIETYETLGGEMRFRMLEAFREFAHDQLAPEEREATETARDAYFLRLSEVAFASLGTSSEQASLARLQTEYDNLMHALERAAERRDVEFGLRLCVGFGQVWRSRGAVVHERAVLESLIEMPERESLDPELQMRGLNLLSHASFLLCDWERSLEAERRTMEIAERCGSEEYMAVAYGGTSLALLGLRRRNEALQALERAVIHARKSGKERRLSLLLGNLGFLSWQAGDLSGAEAHFHEALAIARQQSSDSQANHLTLNIARILVDSNRLDEAMEILPGCLTKVAQQHRSHDMVMALSVMARCYRLTGETGRAWALTQIAIQRVLPLMNETSEAYVGVEAALELLELRRYSEATTLLSSVAKHDLSLGDQRDIESALDRCRNELNAQEFDRAWAVGVSQSVGDALRRVCE